VLVRPGERVPADGEIIAGTSAPDDSILTGESRAESRGPGGRVLGGSTNLTSVLKIRVTRLANASFAGQLNELVARAQALRPHLPAAQVRLARGFTAAVLVVSVMTALAWQLFGPSGAWFEPTLAVLVVACPCALALALPAASTAAHAGLLDAGVAVLNPRALERIAAVNHVVFDKTGTLTSGDLSLREVIALGGSSVARVLALARALAALSNHPLARAVAGSECEQQSVVDGQVYAGGGIRGVCEGERVALGSRTFIEECFPRHVLPAISDDPCSEAWVASEGGVLGRLEFEDRPRPHAEMLVKWLRGQAIDVSMASGDRTPAVRALAHALGIHDWYAALTPRGKLDHVSALQERGKVVAAIGDGVNDAPILAEADVSIAVADSSAAARQQADILLLRPDLPLIARVFASSRAWRRVAGQNSKWALAYNGLAIPAAACGLLSPWLAALGMSLSSLVVIVNALRLRGTGCPWT